MPNQQINQVERIPVAESTPLGEQVESTPVSLHVSWHREGEWVQLFIEGDTSYFRFAANNPTVSDERSSVYTPPLSRDEINKLIRTLRRARDQVYGRDE